MGRKVVLTAVLPEPPPLGEAVPGWAPAQLYWTVKHGIRMGGMPAFGPTHDDRPLWGGVAFLQRLPETDSAEYTALRHRWGGEHGHGAAAGGHEDEHGHQH